MAGAHGGPAIRLCEARGPLNGGAPSSRGAPRGRSRRCTLPPRNGGGSGGGRRGGSRVKDFDWLRRRGRGLRFAIGPIPGACAGHPPAVNGGVSRSN